MAVAVLPELDESSLVNQVRLFFSTDRVRDTLVPLIEQTSGVSLRLLDWLCVNYSKRRNIVCCGKDGVLRNIHNDYKLTLSVYRRCNFDPFRRKTRSSVRLDGTSYPTTLAQCNFVYWAYERGVLDYAAVHLDAVEADMNAFSHQHRSHLRELKRRGIKHRRSSLTPPGRSICRIYTAPSRVSFCVDG